jgi:hypothetical protein
VRMHGGKESLPAWSMTRPCKVTLALTLTLPRLVCRVSVACAEVASRQAAGQVRLRALLRLWKPFLRDCGVVAAFGLFVVTWCDRSLAVFVWCGRSLLTGAWYGRSSCHRCVSTVKSLLPMCLCRYCCVVSYALFGVFYWIG